MLLLKIHWHFICFIKKVLYKIIYGRKVKFGKNVQFRKGFSIVIADGGYIEIGDGCFFNNYCSLNSLKTIKIGNNCIFGENVKIYDHNHVFKYDKENIKNQGYKMGDINIGDNCWIGSGCVILKGSKIGKNTVVSAMSKIKGIISDCVVYDNETETKIKYEKREENEI